MKRIAWIAAGLLFLAPPLIAGTIGTLAGGGGKGFGGDHGQATEAQLNDPAGITLRNDGSLYVCDTANHRIRRITPDGRIWTVAGTGEPGWSGDGGQGQAAKLNEPYEVRFDRSNDLVWVERLSHCVRKLEAKSGRISTIAGSGTAGFSGDGGPATQAQLNEPHSIGFDREGNLFICDVGNHRIRKVDGKTGIIATFAGTGEKKTAQDGASITGAALYGPRALDFDHEGNLWVALREGNMILKLDLEKGSVQWMAGTGKKGFTGDGGPAREATLAGPKGLSAGPDGNIYFADTENHAIRMIETKRGTIELVAGTGTPGDGPDGDPRKCRLARPHGIFVDKSGLIYIGDTEAQRIRVIRP